MLITMRLRVVNDCFGNWSMVTLPVKMGVSS